MTECLLIDLLLTKSKLMNLSKKVDSIKIVLPPQDPFHFHESFPRKIEIVHIL